MRIAIFHDLPSGGALRMLAGWMPRLASGHELDLFLLSSAERDFANLSGSAGRTFVLEAPSPPVARPIVGPLPHLAYLRRLDRVHRAVAGSIDAGGYDVAFVHSSRLSHSPALLRYLSTPSVYFCQEPARRIFDGPPPGDLRDRIVGAAARRREVRAARAATRVLANSEFSAANLRRLYGLEPRVQRLGIDADLFRPASGIPEGGHVLSVGAISPAKGYRFLIDALGRLPGDRPDLVLAGDRVEPGEPEALAAHAESSGVRLELRVKVGDLELALLHQRSLAFVYAPHAEPLGLAPLEAMACGKPVVAVAEGGVLETVGPIGELVERDPDAFARRLASLLADPTRRAELGRLGREHVEREWSLDSSAAGVERHLLEVAGR